MTSKKIFIRKKKAESVNLKPTGTVVASDHSISQDTNDDDEGNSEIKHSEDYSTVINYEQIYQQLLSMLANNTILVQEVLELARVMFKAGVRYPEIQAILTKAKKRAASYEIGNDATKYTVQNKKSSRSR